VAIHPGMVEDLAARTRDLYADAEARLLGIIARQLARGLDAPGWVEAKLSAVQPVRRAAQAVVDELGRAVSLDVMDAVAEAYNVGHRSAVAELGALSDADIRRLDTIAPGAQAVDRLAEETVTLLQDTHRSILRAVDDGYRAVVSEVTATPLLGTGTRRQATQDAMTRFADRGLTSFVDRSGRRWQMTSYAEMAVRTSVGRAATEAHARTLTDAGIDLVVVSDSPRECPLCRPWERKVLSLTGDGARTIEVEHATDDGRMVTVDVAGSLDEARRKGLQHPNCRHSTSAYLPGLTEVGNATSDPDGYEAGQRQRAIERNIRRWKNREAAAVTPEAKRAAAAAVRQHQAAMREHLAAHPDLRRNRKREQPGASNLPPKQTEATPEQMHAARVWSGDDASVRAMSDDDLAAAMHSNLLDDRARARIEREADRRDAEALRDAVFPGGHLAADLTEASDDVLGWAMQHATRDETLRILDEMDRRAPLPDLDVPVTGDPVVDVATAHRALDEVMPAPVTEWGQYADDVASLAETVAGVAEEETERRITRREAREMWWDHVMQQRYAAEDATNGYLVNRAGQAAGISPDELFTGPAARAYRYASDELKAFWREHPRVTQAEFVARATGTNTRDAVKAAEARWAAQQKHDG
jgi:Phage minor capsid protein 2